MTPQQELAMLMQKSMGKGNLTQSEKDRLWELQNSVGAVDNSGQFGTDYTSEMTKGGTYVDPKTSQNDSALTNVLRDIVMDRPKIKPGFIRINNPDGSYKDIPSSREPTQVKKQGSGYSETVFQAAGRQVSSGLKNKNK